MALTSPGVEVTIIDQSQYLPAPTSSIPLVLLATAQNKADATGTGVASATTAANAGKLFQITSQRDLVSLYGNPFFYTTTNGTPIQGYELNEYGLLAAYSLLGVTNRCFVLRADIDLASLIGKTGRPTGAPTDGTYWLDTINSTWGLYEFNSTTGQFAAKLPIVITDASLLQSGLPIDSVGAIGDYAVNAIEITGLPNSSLSREFFYKGSDNTWVQVGTEAWLNNWPTIQSTESNPELVAGSFTLSMSGLVSATFSVLITNTIDDVAGKINSLGSGYMTASVSNGKLNIFSAQPDLTGAETRYLGITGDADLLAAMGIVAGNYYQPQLRYGTSAQMPLWQTGQLYPRPTGSVWLKVGTSGNGLSPILSQYNAAYQRWNTKTINFSTSDWASIATLDSTGGKAIPAGTILGKYNFNGEYNRSPIYLYERIATGPTVVTGTVLDPAFDNGPYTATIRVSVPGSETLSSAYSFSLADNSDATDFVTAWAAAGVPYTTAIVTTEGSIQISHTQGGVIVVDDVNSTGVFKGISNGLMETAGFAIGDSGVTAGPSNSTTFTVDGHSGSGTGTQAYVVSAYGTYLVSPYPADYGTGYSLGEEITFYGTDLGGTSPENDCVVKVAAVNGSTGVTRFAYVSGSPSATFTTQLSNWYPLTYTSNEGAPVTNPPDGTNWFYSVIDEVDIMINYGGNWSGYRMQGYDSSGFPSPSTPNATDPNGPIVSASEPSVQSDGTSLVWGDLWISTADLENYPVIYRWQRQDYEDKWVLIDNTDQVSSTGVLFADARWATNETTNVTDDPLPTIKSLLLSDYLDLDAPESAMYPTGMLLFNTRRSGYNVKQFRVNYFNNTNFPGATLPVEANAWVTVSGLQANGSPFMGRKAQRAMVVQAMRAALDVNTDVRDEDNAFNLIAAPNYPELQPNMVVLNNDRGNTGYILGDTPLGLKDGATEIQAWATNAAGATSTGEDGCVTRDTYLGLFYPSGIAADLNGNLVTVPASHMMLRTFLRNDTVAYPWLAAAGTRRGIIDNATNIGYLDRATGEFQTIKTRIGIRDTLYSNFINPLVFFTGNGLLNYGNKTSYNSSSALDRTNVARLVAYIRRQLTLAARPFVFEPNDALTRKQIAGVVESLMVDLVAKRGLYDYLVVCDESNNTPSRIDRNELWVDVAIEPVKAAEFIYIPVRIMNTGELSA